MNGGRSPVDRHIGFDTDPVSRVRWQVFLPMAQSRFPCAASFYVRACGASGELHAALRRNIGEPDPL